MIIERLAAVALSDVIVAALGLTARERELAALQHHDHYQPRVTRGEPPGPYG